ncbi:winged helix-turn-helix domain-containing protein [Telmatospirillum siberiense]|uniref:Cytoplasmic protein n=1 Tax=Telmatospirillum siberiense TaxID=382514 RepID=A0A2N3PUL4_9PROT|nr:crosslink repair DNA glycosylase YcaQ family protein [Telmatospirillum siberiense]PKU24094.1 cytoplasmic protein [Telmatospirillum siberiense]
MTVPTSYPIVPAKARSIWLRAQRLDVFAPFGDGPEAVSRAVEHLGYVQIDTINVIERSHHHILYTRVPGYVRGDLQRAQSVDRSVFEYWTHALAYVPTPDYRFFVPAMDRFRANPLAWFAGVDAGAYAALLRRIREEGALSIRDIDDDVLVEKTHPWESRKPSKKALRKGFFVGDLAISGRSGMLKTYELSARHFGWRRRPRPATDAQCADYLLRRAIRSQGIVSLESICYGNSRAKAQVMASIEAAVRRRRLIPVHLAGRERAAHWAEPALLEEGGFETPPLVHILSPFDPLVIQRKRLELFFNYQHRFEAYVPAARRLFGYFALPVLAGDEIVAVVDLKMDRRAGRLLIQKWTWTGEDRAGLRPAIDEALDRFERFQASGARDTEDVIPAPGGRQ